MKALLFTIRWFWHNRLWNSSRQKYKCYDRQLDAYLERGVKPW